ncbi:Zn-dependent protease with chaperone function [Runella defluvii]|uniref:Zn-dependent protease with chaperone function n=1 Tax=Runella defluvii TaxID=370973 RepID=A0A7W6ES30_9BACT|nr:M48 family metallopeptidase [Runella defluvii]MBB3840076.1 Zn-dependent protease with chaperone function [Runella defluvii]
MPTPNIQLTSDFKKMTTKAILAISFFVIVYLILIVLAIGLTLLSSYLGIMFITLKVQWITIAVGIGLIVMGLLVLLFLLKFMFKKHIVDRSHLVELTAESDPHLFAFIDSLVKEVGTQFPKKIYLSADVNACVFYDSSFWSMFLPIRKNLQIGLALVNSVSVHEFKAILAHEFGHFSQRSMKIGSYVYNVNQIIYNMLYENNWYGTLAQKIADIHAIIGFFVMVAVKIIQGIQFILRKVYEVVNLSYMSLSREMEFHADEVAAHIAGSKPLITSLLRFSLADEAYNNVLSYYDERFTEAVTTNNIYPQHYFVLNFLGKENGLPVVNQLPMVGLEQLNRYNKSKLVITDQWASHPSTEDRIKRLEQLDLLPTHEDLRPASAVFSHIEAHQQLLTQKIFSTVVYSKPTTELPAQKFAADYTENYHKRRFSSFFNGYFDSQNLLTQLPNEPSNFAPNRNLDELFGAKMLETLNNTMALSYDLIILKQIAEDNTGIKTFDYDGVKYTVNDLAQLLPSLEKELDELKVKVEENDHAIYHYFHHLATQKGEIEQFNVVYRSFIEFDRWSDEAMAISGKLSDSLQFIQETTPFETIRENLITVGKIEGDFKQHIGKLLDFSLVETELSPQMKESFKKYLSKTWDYFTQPSYDDEAINVLFDAIRNFNTAVTRGYFLYKKQVLYFYESLVSAPLD